MTDKIRELEKKLLQLFQDMELDALGHIEAESDRGAVLVAAALLDNGLKGRLSELFLKSDDSKDQLFEGGNAPLGTFSAKIELAYRLKLIDKECKKSLNTFRKLRNDFAHEVGASKLSDSRIKDRLIASIEHYPYLVATLKERHPEMNNGFNNVNPRSLFNTAFSILYVDLYHSQKTRALTNKAAEHKHKDACAGPH